MVAFSWLNTASPSSSLQGKKIKQSKLMDYKRSEILKVSINLCKHTQFTLLSMVKFLEKEIECISNKEIRKQRKPHSKNSRIFGCRLYIYITNEVLGKHEALDLIYKNHDPAINECFQLLVC